jgi:hypothetical protein
LKTLEASIQQVGILVPLTVYQEKGSDHYTILARIIHEGLAVAL